MAFQEPLFATASRGDVWLLLEYAGAWPARALDDSGLPELIKAWFARQVHSLPHARAHLIKQRPRRDDAITFFVAVADPLRPRLYELHLDAYDDLLDLDLAALVAGTDHLRQMPIYLVCTHGVHDKCCAKYGWPIYREMTGLAGEAVWQCSHIGGDRFAANVACFPHGVFYGRVAVGDMAAIVETYRAGRIHFEKYRGLAYYSFVTQAADYYLRLRTGVHELPGFRLVGAERAGDNRWRIQFASTLDGQLHRVHVTREKTGLQSYLSCKATRKRELIHYAGWVE
jgi:hypothetical protein